ncbi:hypothetical protein ASD84_04335 [Nocardioides sp. Root682]|nr:hypothetical protein ASD84_04335 [Nocardioides sp. Root682]
MWQFVNGGCLEVLRLSLVEDRPHRVLVVAVRVGVHDEVAGSPVGDPGKAPRPVRAGGIDEVFALDRLAAKDSQYSVRAVLQNPQGVGVMECDDFFSELFSKTGQAALGEDLEQLRASFGCRTRHWTLLYWLDGREVVRMRSEVDSPAESEV